MNNENKLKLFSDLVNSCLVPELKQDLDSAPIQTEHFDEYRHLLRQNLPLLYDFVQQEKLVLGQEDNTQEAHGIFIALLCEITADRYENPFKLNDGNLLDNANKLLQRQKPLPAAIFAHIFTYYQSKLRRDTWKRHLGATHGFVTFLDVFYSDECDRLTSNFLSFCLSVGICVRDTHDPLYKQMSTGIFYAMLQHGQPEEIREMNIHSVVYDAVFKDIYQIDSIKSVDVTWRCLCRCLDFDDKIDSFNWSTVDDMMEALLKSIATCSDGLVTSYLVKYITKLSCYFAINKQEIYTVCTSDWSRMENLDACRLVCSSNSSHTIFRWAKSILNMLNAESYKLELSANICHQLLLEMHKCYLVSILPIALPIIEPQLGSFYNNFTKALMKTMASYSGEKRVVELVRQVIETFSHQLVSSPQCASIDSLLKYRDAYEQLLQHETFVQSKLEFY